MEHFLLHSCTMHKSVVPFKMILDKKKSYCSFPHPESSSPPQKMPLSHDVLLRLFARLFLALPKSFPFPHDRKRRRNPVLFLLLLLLLLSASHAQPVCQFRHTSTTISRGQNVFLFLYFLFQVLNTRRQGMNKEVFLSLSSVFSVRRRKTQTD